MIDQIWAVWIRRRNTIILVLLALLFAQCTITPRIRSSSNLYANLYERGKHEARGEMPPALKVNGAPGTIKRYGAKSPLHFFLIGTTMKKNKQIILQKMGMEYLTKLRNRYDTEGYYSQWEVHPTIYDIKKSSTLGAASLRKLKTYCEKDKKSMQTKSSNALPEMPCRTLTKGEIYYAFSKKGITIVSSGGKYVTTIFTVNSSDL